MKQLFYFLFLFVIAVNAQTSEKGEVTYLDFNHKPTIKEKASYYEFKIPYKGEIIKFQKYYIASNTKAYLVEKYYLDKEDRKQGKYNSYFKDGIIKFVGIYKDDQKFGPWKNYKKAPFISLDSIDNSSYLASLKYYKDDFKNGKFKEFYEDGSIQGEGQYKNNNLYDECKWYHRNGQLSSLEFYKENGKIKDIQQWDEKGVESYKKLKPNHNTKASLILLSHNLKRYLSSGMNKNIYKKYPNQNGKVYVQILLDKKGKIHVMNTKSTFGITLGYENDIKKIIQKMPLQKPIYYHNQLVALRFTLPIVIRPIDIDNIKYKNSNKYFDKRPFTNNK